MAPTQSSLRLVKGCIKRGFGMYHTLETLQSRSNPSIIFIITSSMSKHRFHVQVTGIQVFYSVSWFRWFLPYIFGQHAFWLSLLLLFSLQGALALEVLPNRSTSRKWALRQDLGQVRCGFMTFASLHSGRIQNAPEIHIYINMYIITTQYNIL